MSAAVSTITMFPAPRAKARRGGQSTRIHEHVIARPITLPLDIADLYREWQEALDAQILANRKLRGVRSPSQQSGFVRSADAAAYRVTLAREAFVMAMKLAAEARA